jgi:septal ring factor EnvC (AmiA/AmiB activator)
MKSFLRYGALPLALSLAGFLRAADDATPAPGADDLATLRADNKQLSDELAAAWKESAGLKAQLDDAQAATAKSTAAAADLQAQLDAAKAPAPAPADAGGSQLADVQDKLATALRSFTVVQDEEAQLRASLDKANSDNESLTQQLDAARATIASLQAQAAAAAQIAPLQTELRQAQDEASQLAAANEQLRTRQALESPSPGSSRPVPMRPDQAAAAPAAPAAPAPPPPPKTYVVVEGDTLTKISRKFYGSSSHWEEILDANHDVLKDEKSLVVGSTLKIP